MALSSPSRSTQSIIHRLNQVRMKCLLKQCGLCSEYILTSSLLSSPVHTIQRLRPLWSMQHWASAALRPQRSSFCSSLNAYMHWNETLLTGHPSPEGSKLEASTKLEHRGFFPHCWLLQGITYTGYKIQNGPTRQRLLLKRLHKQPLQTASTASWYLCQGWDPEEPSLMLLVAWQVDASAVPTW